MTSQERESCYQFVLEKITPSLGLTPSPFRKRSFGLRKYFCIVPHRNNPLQVTTRLGGLSAVSRCNMIGRGKGLWVASVLVEDLTMSTQFQNQLFKVLKPL